MTHIFPLIFFLNQNPNHTFAMFLWLFVKKKQKKNLDVKKNVYFCIELSFILIY